MSKLKIILFLSAIFSSFVWIILVPLWHFPDEQAHFGQVAYIGETGKTPQGERNDLTNEIYTSEVLLGTERDNLGNNEFTFHPEYRIEYSDSLYGIYEASISALAKSAEGHNFVYKEATRYPDLYYIPAAIIYRLFYNANLFIKVFMVRFYSMFLLLLNIYFIYKLGKLFFQNNLLFVLSYSLLVIFMPMFLFSNTGVNSDALGNLLFTVYLYLSLKLFKKGLNGSIALIVQLLSIVFLSIYTKPQFFITFPLSFLTVLFVFLRESRGKKKKIEFIMLSVIIFTALYLVSVRNHGLLALISEFKLDSFIKFSLEYTLPHTWKEVLPWYWGIYDWLGVTYPRIVHKIINRVVIISILGLLYKTFRFIISGKKPDRIQQGVIFLIIIQVVYFAGISYYDWLSWYKSGYQLGVQGRYFFPLISLQMYLLLLGWKSIFPNYRNLKIIMVKGLAVSMIFLNFYALFLIYVTYYPEISFRFPASGFRQAVNYIGQYKPEFIKGNFLIVLAVFYLLSVGMLLYKYLRMNDNTRSK